MAFEDYQKQFDNIDGIKSLLKTPLLIRMVIDVLPGMVERYSGQPGEEIEHISIHDLYDAF